MKHDLYFQYVVAVSAGACNGMSYISKQPRRARFSNIDLLSKYDYIGLRHLVTQGCIFDQKLLYDKFPNEYVPFDFDTYFSSPSTFEIVTTNCLTGLPAYLTDLQNKQRALDIVDVYKRKGMSREKGMLLFLANACMSLKPTPHPERCLKG